MYHKPVLKFVFIVLLSIGIRFLIVKLSTQQYVQPPSEEAQSFRSERKSSSSKEFQDCADCPTMIVLVGSSFQMGITKSEADASLNLVPSDGGTINFLKLFGLSDRQVARRAFVDEQPAHEVTIGHAFAIGIYPVLVWQFRAFVKATGYKTGLCEKPGAPRPTSSMNIWYNPGYQQSDNDPVVCVTWNDAQAYIRWLNVKYSESNSRNDKTKQYRLPSESEWEYAARAGSSTLYPWGNHIIPGQVLCSNCEGVVGDVNGITGLPVTPTGTMSVGRLPANAFGLFDMIGNVMEFVEDCWHAQYEGAPQDGQPWLGQDCQYRVNRGDSWQGPAWFARSSSREPQPTSRTFFDRGFRVAKDL